MKKKYILTLIALCMTVCVFGSTACKRSKEPNSSSQSESSEEVSIPSLTFTERKIEMLIGETRQLSFVDLEEGETVKATLLLYNDKGTKITPVSLPQQDY